ncbi:MAG: hypothetical protein WBW32_10830 [Luteibacter sp.]
MSIRNMTMENVAYCYAKHGRITGDEPDHEEIAWIIAEIRNLASREASGEPVTGEAVAEITRGPDNEFSVSWLIEGGIDAMIEGETLYILGMKCPDDGGVELYTHPAAPEAAKPMGEPPLAGRWHHGKGFLCCGTFRIAREDWEAGVCAAPGMRAKVFDWMCARLNDAPYELSTQGTELISRAIGAHAAVVSYIVHGRADLALAESAQWVEGFKEAAERLKTSESAEEME